MTAKTAILCAVSAALLAVLTPEAFGAEQAQASLYESALICMAAALAVGLACIASGFALARIGSSAMGAMSEKPELGGRALIFLGMAEGIAIYGLIIAIMILNKL